MVKYLKDEDILEIEGDIINFQADKEVKIQLGDDTEGWLVIPAGTITKAAQKVRITNSDILAITKIVYFVQ
jgi:hypothetical protein